MRKIETTDDVIETLGGLKAIADLTGTRVGATYNWKARYRGRFPPRTYLPIARALSLHGLIAPVHLWGWDQPPSASVPASKGEAA